jgi:hypothetical protein
LASSLLFHFTSSIAFLTATVSSRQNDETTISIADFFPPNHSFSIGEYEFCFEGGCLTMTMTTNGEKNRGVIIGQ